MTKDELIYLAGFIDGEGCIHTNKHSIAKPTVMLHIVNTNLEVLQWIASILNCKVYPKTKTNTMWKDSYAVYVGSKKCRELLPRLLPYLRVKKNHAEVALKILSLPYGSGKQRQDLADALSLLNRRGT